MKIFALLFLLLLSSCNVEKIGTAIESKIIGGSLVSTKDWPSVVHINLGYWDGNCSGTLIDSRTVLTAAHCAQGKNPLAMSIKVQNSAGTKTYRVASARVHPRYNNNTSYQNFDVAYLTLTEDLTEPNYFFIPLVNEDELQDISEGTEIIMVGYGKTETGSSGRKLKTSTPILAISGSEVLAGSATANTCQGDSGGPAFVQLQNGQYRQLGITSRGPEGCRGVGIYELTTANIGWIAGDKKLVQGIKLYENGQYRQAIEMINQSIKLFPLDEIAYRYVAECAKRIGDSEMQQEYTQTALEIRNFFQQRLVNYYLTIFDFKQKLYPDNQINYGCNRAITVDATPFKDQQEFFYLNVGCTDKVKIKVRFNNLYQDIKDQKLHHIYLKDSISHRMKIYFPEEEISEGAWSTISKIFRCTTASKCPEKFDAQLSFTGQTKTFLLYDTYGMKKDQINLSWNLN